MQNQRVAFGLAATTIALKARVGQLRTQDQVDFAVRVLEFAMDDDLARLAVVDFLTHVRRDPAAAGARLQDFVNAWSCGSIDPHHPERILAEMPETTADWQPEENNRPKSERRLQ
jgi:hypothetical protein